MYISKCLYIQICNRMSHYAAMKYHAITEPYLLMNLPFSICSIISQLQIGLYSIKMGDRKITNNTKCPLCASGYDASVDHLIMHCKILTPSRNKNLHVKDFTSLLKCIMTVVI